ncbi:MAG TPA: hypothetical protein DD670_11165 [Planctomycetaceae bacterium]|nr:hypothetical protein [Planctomycetaceae bacterium]
MSLLEHFGMEFSQDRILDAQEEPVLVVKGEQSLFERGFGRFGVPTGVINRRLGWLRRRSLCRSLRRRGWHKNEGQQQDRSQHTRTGRPIRTFTTKPPRSRRSAVSPCSGCNGFSLPMVENVHS